MISGVLERQVKIEVDTPKQKIQQRVIEDIEMTNIEEVNEEIEILLRRCNEEELKNIATDLEIAGVESKTRRQTLRAIESEITEVQDDKERFRLLKDLDFPQHLKDQHLNLFRTSKKRVDAEEELSSEKAIEIPKDFYIHIRGKDKITRVEVGPQSCRIKDDEELVIGPKEMINVADGYYCVVENPVLIDDLKSVVFKDGEARLRIGEVEIRQHQDPFPLYSGEILKVKPRAIVDVDERPVEQDSLFDTVLDADQMSQGVEGAMKARIRSEIKEELRKEKLLNSTSLEESFRQIADRKNSAFRRELKIQGSIGGKKENRIEYLSLCGQIREAKQRGYEDDEICFAIKKAVAPSSEIREYLDTQHGKMKLDDLLTCIRSSYQEKSASALFQDLTKLCQNSSEDAQAFLFRALGLRQKVVEASEADEEIKYDTTLVQSTFLHSVWTGLKVESIRAHMKPYLEHSRKTKDGELITEMTKASAEENERNSKLTSDAKTVRIQEVSSGLDKLVQPLADQITAMGLQMKEMQNELVLQNERMKRSERSSEVSPKKVWKRSACDKCTKDGIRFCRHCWKCGGDGHMSRSCQTTGMKEEKPSN